MGIVRLELLGGEPFLRKDFANLCNFVNKEGFLYTIITNGEYLSSLDKKTINAIKAASEIIISVDAFGKIHDDSRKRPGLFYKIIDGIQLLKKLNIKCSLLCTINKNTASSLDDLINYLKPLEIDLFVRPTILSGNAKNNNLLNVNMTEIYNKYKNTPHVFHNTVNLVDEISESKYYGCDIRHLLNIDVKGNFLLCHMDRSIKESNIDFYILQNYY